MRNASVAALIYEFLFDVYRMMNAEREHNVWLPDEHGVVREAFDHAYTSCWGWSTSILEEVGATRPLRSRAVLGFDERDIHQSIPGPFSYPAMTLNKCLRTDFSEFETFDNYCYAMFTLYQLIGQTSGSDDVDLAVHSTRFLDEVAAKDDIFSVELGDIYQVQFKRDRFEEKVMTRWREIDVRGFRRKGSG